MADTKHFLKQSQANSIPWVTSEYWWQYAPLVLGIFVSLDCWKLPGRESGCVPKSELVLKSKNRLSCGFGRTWDNSHHNLTGNNNTIQYNTRTKWYIQITLILQPSHPTFPEARDIVERTLIAMTCCSIQMLANMNYRKHYDKIAFHRASTTNSAVFSDSSNIVSTQTVHNSALVNTFFFLRQAVTPVELLLKICNSVA